MYAVERTLALFGELQGLAPGITGLGGLAQGEVRITANVCLLGRQGGGNRAVEGVEGRLGLIGRDLKARQSESRQTG